jgi:LCP family protein required for cell wall assembly
MADGPEYRKYRSAPRLGRKEDDLLAGLRDAPRPATPEDDDRRVYGGRERRFGRPRVPRVGRPRSPWRLVRLALGAALAWVLLSAVVFVVSATIHQTGGADDALAGGGAPPFSPTTVLVLGSDARSSATDEPGDEGPPRSDTIMLMRLGGGESRRLSIPRDAIADIPGRGRQKINAAYAIGGASLAVQTVEGFLGIEVDHLVEVDFENFPELIDAMGGIDVRTGCVVSRINGGARNGGVTLRLRKGENHLTGKQALALARTRKNLCRPNESDLARARRQQAIFSGMKGRLTSPGAFVRLPFIAWKAPRAVRSDMGGVTLTGLVAAIVASGDAPTRVLRPSGGETLPDGGAGLVVDEATRLREGARLVGAG